MFVGSDHTRNAEDEDDIGQTASEEGFHGQDGIAGLQTRPLMITSTIFLQIG